MIALELVKEEDSPENPLYLTLQFPVRPKKPVSATLPLPHSVTRQDRSLTLPCDGTQVQDTGLIYGVPTSKFSTRAGLQRKGDTENHSRVERKVEYDPGMRSGQPAQKSIFLPHAGDRRSCPCPACY